jgi:hypothetical protein
VDTKNRHTFESSHTPGQNPGTGAVEAHGANIQVKIEENLSRVLHKLEDDLNSPLRPGTVQSNCLRIADDQERRILW